MIYGTNETDEVILTWLDYPRVGGLETDDFGFDMNGWDNGNIYRELPVYAYPRLNINGPSLLMPANPVIYYETMNDGHLHPELVSVVQTKPAISWIVRHNLNKLTPIVKCYDSSYTEITPVNINYYSYDTCIITFSAPVKGTTELL